MEIKEIIFKTEDENIVRLSERDPILGKLIPVIGDYSIVLQDRYFEALIQKMIGQLLSVQAATAIRKRVAALCPDLTPASLHAVSDDDLRTAGLSRSKVSFVRDLIVRVENGQLNLEKLPSCTNEEVIKELTQVKGIGLWTAQVFMIFSLGRLNILPAADIGLQRGIRWLYQLETADIDFDALYKKWSPYSTAASLYIWEIVNRNYEKDYNNIDELISTL